MQTDVPATAWLGAIDARGGPLFLQIVQSLEDGIAAGRLREGDRLTPQRAVAARPSRIFMNCSSTAWRRCCCARTSTC